MRSFRGLEADCKQTRKPFNLTDTICGISENPHKQLFISKSNDDDESTALRKISKRDCSSTDSSPDGSLLDYGYQLDNVHLYLSDMLISSLEQMQWNEIKNNLDFSHPVNPENLFDIEHKIDTSSKSLNHSISESFSEPCGSYFSSSETIEIPNQSKNETRRCSESFDKTSHKLHYFQKREGNSIFYADIKEKNDTNMLNNSLCSQEATSSEIIQSNNRSKHNVQINPVNNETVIIKALLNYEKVRGKDVTNSDQLACLASCAESPQNLVQITKEFPLPAAEPSHNLLGKKTSTAKKIWRPPKKSFIFELSNVNTKDFITLLTLQNNRCAGCGIKFNSFYAKRARLCYYYTKLFCNCCHQDDKARIPAHILQEWNFKYVLLIIFIKAFREYSVSDCASKFLKENEDQPVFDVKAINANLYKKIRNLKRVRNLRIQLSHMWQYIQLCSFAENCQTTDGLMTMFVSIPKRFLCLENVDVFSMMDFYSIANRNLIEIFEPISYFGSEHIQNCIQCQHRAFICQICVDPLDLLFPFQLDKVYRCEGCGSLSHKKCYAQQVKRGDDMKCSKCERIRKKR